MAGATDMETGAGAGAGMATGEVGPVVHARFTLRCKQARPQRARHESHDMGEKNMTRLISTALAASSWQACQPYCAHGCRVLNSEVRQCMKCNAIVSMIMSHLLLYSSIHGCPWSWTFCCRCCLSHGLGPWASKAAVAWWLWWVQLHTPHTLQRQRHRPCIRVDACSAPVVAKNTCRSPPVSSQHQDKCSNGTRLHSKTVRHTLDACAQKAQLCSAVQS